MSRSMFLRLCSRAPLMEIRRGSARPVFFLSNRSLFIGIPGAQRSGARAFWGASGCKSIGDRCEHNENGCVALVPFAKCSQRMWTAEPEMKEPAQGRLSPIYCGAPCDHFQTRACTQN